MRTDGCRRGSDEARCVYLYDLVANLNYSGIPNQDVHLRRE